MIKYIEMLQNTPYQANWSVSLPYGNKTILHFRKIFSAYILAVNRKSVKSGLQGVNSAQLTEIKWDYVWQWKDKGGNILKFHGNYKVLC